MAYKPINSNDGLGLTGEHTGLVEKPSYTQASKGKFRIFVIVLIISAVLLLAFRSISSSLNSHIHPAPDTNIVSGFAVVFDEKTSRLLLIDNNPVACTQSNVSFSACQHGISTILAHGSYELNVNGNGWHYLNVTALDMRELELVTPKQSNESSPDFLSQSSDTEPIKVFSLLQQAGSNSKELMQLQYLRSMEAVGFLEGYLTCTEIGYWYENFYSGLFSGGDVDLPTLQFLESNYVWMIEEAAKQWRDDDYWMAVQGMLAQMQGMLAGVEQGFLAKILASNNDVTNGTITKTKKYDHFNGAGGNSGNIRRHNSSDVDMKAELLNDRHYGGVYLPSMAPEFGGISMIHLLLMNANGDLFQIMEKYSSDSNNTRSRRRHTYNNPEDKWLEEGYNDIADIINDFENNVPTMSSSNNNEKSPAQQAADALLLNTPNIGTDHCSALIKLLPDKSDVVFGHDTWDDYQCAYPRIFKYYKYNVMKDSMPMENAQFEVYFSASPGLLASMDDFYVIHGAGPEDAHLAVTETSLDMFNTELLNQVLPNSLFCWMRSIVSNQLAYSGKTWAETFSRYHSGTYANQWMVLDLNKFHPLDDPEEGFLTVLEELPGYIYYEDKTDHLMRTGYWASFNAPYFQQTANLSGSAAKCQLNAAYCYENDPRAVLFRQHQGDVVGISGLQTLLQYNHFSTDRASRNDSCESIACRGDLQPKESKRSAFGAIDVKISSANLAKYGQSKVISNDVAMMSSSSNLGKATYKKTTTSSSSSSGSTSSSSSGGSTTSSPTAVVVHPDTRKQRTAPVILTKLGPTHDTLPPFCWHNVEVDGTIISVVNVTTTTTASTTSSRKLLRQRNSHSKLHQRSLLEQQQQHHKDDSFLTKKYVHRGHPDCFTFNWQVMPPVPHHQ